MEAFHTPVMVKEVITYLNCRPGGLYVDGTLGGGGHAEAILRVIGREGILIGIDRDGEAIARTKERLRDFSSQVILVKGSFSHLKEILQNRNIGEVDGILFDLGVSCYQLIEPRRGFSFSHEGPLDMRMDREQKLTAHELVNTFPEHHLASIIKQYGEERWAARIAKAIVERRQYSPIATTKELSDIVVGALPAHTKSDIHPATRTFLALRIFVNNELDQLREGIKEGLEYLKSGGRFVVIAFHSLEDRIVKESFREAAKACHCPPGVPVCVCGGQSKFNLITKKAVKPSAEEIRRNPQARSARLRAIERV